VRDRKVLFIYPPNQLMPIETPRPDGSLGPLYLIGALRQIGIEADLLDATLEGFDQIAMQENGLVRIGLTPDQISEKITGYDVIGIHSNHAPQTRFAFEVARLAKAQGKRVIAGGVNARAMKDRFFQTGWFDDICLTEGERYIVGESGFVKNLDKLPFPAWDKLLLDQYEKVAAPHGVDLTGKQYRYAPLMTSRGCPFQCAYCHISKERFGRSEETGNIGELRLKSVERVLQEIDILQSLGVKKIFIEDDSLLAKKARIIKIFTAIQDKGLVIADVNGVNLVHLFKRTNQRLEPDREYMELLFNAGLQQIVFPVESGSQRVLDKYATGKLILETMDVVNLVWVAKSVGIICPVNMMIGFPDETEQEMMASVELARRLIGVGADYTTFFIPIPFPGSQLYDIALRNGYLKPDFNPDIMNYKNGVMENTTVSKERIVELRDWAWETVNSEEHIVKRLQESIGARWQDK